MNGNNPDANIVIGNLNVATDVREFIDGSRRSCVLLRTAAIGLGTYQPGWKWSLHAKPQSGKDSESHIGYVLSGCLIVKDPSGNEAEIRSGCAFEIVAGSDAWVLGDEACVALDFNPIEKTTR